MKNILIDLDNTMVVCNVYYQFVKANLVKYVSQVCEVDELAVSNKLEEFEVERLNNIDSFSSKTFVEVFEKTILAFHRPKCDGFVTLRNGEIYDSKFMENEVKRAKDLAIGVYDDAPYEVYPNVESALIELDRRGYNLYVVTKGSFYCQLRKLQRLPKVFKGVFILPNKNSEVYEGIVKTIGSVPGETWMVGDSPTDDIVEAAKAGLKTVWVRRKAKLSWVGDPFLERFESDMTVESFDGLLNIFS